MACVEFLKSNGIGRASFIGLDKVQQLELLHVVT